MVVTHVWFETNPAVDVSTPKPAKRLAYSEPWETRIAASKVPGDPKKVAWLARCQISPDGKVFKSRAA